VVWCGALSRWSALHAPMLACAAEARVLQTLLWSYSESFVCLLCALGHSLVVFRGTLVMLYAVAASTQANASLCQLLLQ
jgi:hypothetical protein